MPARTKKQTESVADDASMQDAPTSAQNEMEQDADMVENDENAEEEEEEEVVEPQRVRVVSTCMAPSYSETASLTWLSSCPDQRTLLLRLSLSTKDTLLETHFDILL